MITALMVRTSIPFEVWAGQELETIATALDLINVQQQSNE